MSRHLPAAMDCNPHTQLAMSVKRPTLRDEAPREGGAMSPRPLSINETGFHELDLTLGE
jgi:hypothetical protein